MVAAITWDTAPEPVCSAAEEDTHMAQANFCSRAESRASTLAGFLVALSLLGACSDDTSDVDAGGGQPDAGSQVDGGASLSFIDFDAVIDKFLKDKNLPGATVAVVHKTRGSVYERGYGSFDKNRVSLIASSSKILSVGVLMSLVDAGKLDLDKPINSYLSAWGEFKADLTTAMLVSNSSGLVSLTANPLYGHYICQYTDMSVLKTCAQTIYTAPDTADRKPPDTAFAYGGGQWQLAGGIAEVVSNKSWKDLIQATYVTPCGASSLGYTNQFSRASAEGGTGTQYPMFFMANVANLPVTENPSVEGGAYITAGDYGKILLMHLRGGKCGDTQVLSEASVARMQMDRIKAKYNGSTTSTVLEGYGMGWWVDRVNPGVVMDPGAYGAVAWLDGPRNYGVFVVLEATSALGIELSALLKPAADAIFDANK
jgi:CubicO group peptidase (beta-lactamase class C family)